MVKLISLVGHHDRVHDLAESRRTGLYVDHCERVGFGEIRAKQQGVGEALWRSFYRKLRRCMKRRVGSDRHRTVSQLCADVHQHGAPSNLARDALCTTVFESCRIWHRVSPNNARAQAAVVFQPSRRVAQSAPAATINPEQTASASTMKSSSRACRPGAQNCSSSSMPVAITAITAVRGRFAV